MKWFIKQNEDANRKMLKMLILQFWSTIFNQTEMQFVACSTGCILLSVNYFLLKISTEFSTSYKVFKNVQNQEFIAQYFLIKGPTEIYHY